MRNAPSLPMPMPCPTFGAPWLSPTGFEVFEYERPLSSELAQRCCLAVPAAVDAASVAKVQEAMQQVFDDHSTVKAMEGFVDDRQRVQRSLQDRRQDQEVRDLLQACIAER